MLIMGGKHGLWGVNTVDEPPPVQPFPFARQRAHYEDQPSCRYVAVVCLFVVCCSVMWRAHVRVAGGGGAAPVIFFALFLAISFVLITS